MLISASRSRTYPRPHGLIFQTQVNRVVTPGITPHRIDERSQASAHAFMVHSAAPSSGWLRRTAAQCARLAARAQFADFVQVARSRFCRAALRACGNRVVEVVSALDASRLLGRLLAVDPLLQRELNMRLLIRFTAPRLPRSTAIRSRCRRRRFSCEPHQTRSSTTAGAGVARILRSAKYPEITPRSSS
jgi:hypothetical protein